MRHKILVGAVALLLALPVAAQQLNAGSISKDQTTQSIPLGFIEEVADRQAL